MNRFKGRAIVEFSLDAPDAERAAEAARKYKGFIQIIGVVPADQPWPSEENVTEEFRRPPRNTPPSGSPGTPIIEAQPEPVTAVAA